MKIKTNTIRYNRNGVCGAPFYSIVFTHEKERYIGIVFDESAHVAVKKLSDISSGCDEENFRGDYFEDRLRLAISEYENAG